MDCDTACIILSGATEMMFVNSEGAGNSAEASGAHAS